MAKPKDSWLKRDPHGVLDIPISKYSVVEHIHPDFAERVNAAARDPRIAGTFVVVSGERTYAQQKQKYDAWARWKRTKRGKKPLMAANPDYKHADGTVGSRHQVQPDGYAYALDFDITYAALAACGKRLGVKWNSKESQKELWDALHDTMAEYGVGFPLKRHPTNPERWHAQPFKVYGEWYPVYNSVTLAKPKTQEPPAPWYQEELEDAVALGITNGARPDDPCTRAEAILLARRVYLLHVEGEAPG